MTIAVPNASFRRASAADIDAIISLVTFAYRGTSGWTSEGDYIGGGRITDAVLLEDIERPQSYIILLEDDTTKSLLACAHVQVEGGVGYFGMFSVQPNLQGRGIGKYVMAEGERIIKEEFGLDKVQMAVVDIRDSLIAFYERRGFKRTGESKPFPYGDERFGVPKRDDLKFAILEKTL